MSLDDVTAEDTASANTAVVGALGSGEAVLGPAIGPALDVEESVFLLETEPELVGLVCLHDDGSVVAVVIRVRLAISAVGLAHDEDVVAQAEGVGVEGDGAEVDIGVVAGSLARRRAIEVPLWEVLDLAGELVESLYNLESVAVQVVQKIQKIGSVTAERVLLVARDARTTSQSRVG